MFPNLKKISWKNAGRYLSVITVLVTLYFVVLDHSGQLTSEVAMLRGILWILFFLALSEVLDRSQRLDQILDAVQDDIEIISLETYEEAYGEMARIISRANQEILHAALAPALDRAGTSYQLYERAINKAVEHGIKYWYVAGIPGKGRRERIQRLINHKNFKAVFYDCVDDIPLPSFVIVDNTFLVLNLPTSRVEGDFCFAIVHGELVERFKGYFIELYNKGQPVL